MKKPTAKDELRMLSLQENGVDSIQIPRTNKTVKVGWLQGYTQERLTKIQLKYGVSLDDQNGLKQVEDNARILAKSASAILLNGMRIYFFHWFYWRYLYFIKGYTYDQLYPIIELGKKKVQAKTWWKATACLEWMKTTRMNITEEESESLQSELKSAQEQR